jgi:hypothetical protein
MEASDVDDEYDEDYEDKGRSNDDLLRKIGMYGYKTITIQIRYNKMDT